MLSEMHALLATDHVLNCRIAARLEFLD